MNSYGTLCTRFYDLDKPEAPDVGLRFYLPYLERTTGPALELMCGSGRYMQPFLAAGHDVDGTDASGAMLDACRRRISAKWPNAGIYQQDIDRMKLPRTYGLAVVTSGSFSLLTDLAQVKRALKSVFNLLQPGGSFVGEIQGIDPDEPSRTIEDHRKVSTGNGGEIRLNSINTYDASTGLEHSKTEYLLVENGVAGEIEYEELGLRYYQESEFERLLTGAGFAEISFNAAYPDTSLQDMGGVMLFECSRPLDA